MFGNWKDLNIKCNQVIYENKPKTAYSRDLAVMDDCHGFLGLFYNLITDLLTDLHGYLLSHYRGWIDKIIKVEIKISDFSDHKCITNQDDVHLAWCQDGFQTPGRSRPHLLHIFFKLLLWQIQSNLQGARTPDEEV